MNTIRRPSPETMQRIACADDSSADQGRYRIEWAEKLFEPKGVVLIKRTREVRNYARLEHRPAAPLSMDEVDDYVGFIHARSGWRLPSPIPVANVVYRWSLDRSSPSSIFSRSRRDGDCRSPGVRDGNQIDPP